MPQWKNTSSMSISSAGPRRLAADFGAARAASASVSRRAVPFTRRVSSMPGTKKIRPTPGALTILPKLSTRLLPGRSGSSSVRSSRMRTKPGGSPRGLASTRPSASAVARTRKGESSMKRRQCRSSRGSTLRSAIALIWPIWARSAAESGISFMRALRWVRRKGRRCRAFRSGCATRPVSIASATKAREECGAGLVAARRADRPAARRRTGRAGFARPGCVDVGQQPRPQAGERVELVALEQLERGVEAVGMDQFGVFDVAVEPEAVGGAGGDGDADAGSIDLVDGLEGRARRDEVGGLDLDSRPG